MDFTEHKRVRKNIGKKKVENDILFFDNTIKNKLSQELNDKYIYKQRLSDLNESNNEKKKRKKDEKKDDKEIEELQSIVNDIDNHLYSNYILATHKLIEQYTSLSKQYSKADFMKNVNTIKSKLERNNLLNELITTYSNIINTDFISILKRINLYNVKVSNNDINNIVDEESVVTITFSNDNCVNCGSDDFTITECVSKICNLCGLSETSLINSDINYHDNDRVNTTKKYKYSRIIHFKDTIKQFQGKQNKYIDKKVFADLENEFKEHKLFNPNGKTIHEMYKNINKDHIRMFLLETKHNKHYEDINYLFHYYTGKPLLDISHLEEDLINDFNQILQAYDKLEETNKINFLNGQYILYQLLRRRKFECCEDDFTMLKTIDKKIEHDDYYEQICEILEWKFDSIF